MNILIVSATHFEVKPLLDYLEIKNPINGVNNSTKKINGNSFRLLVTGIGMVNTAFMLGKCLNNDYDLILNVGVCGSFNKTLNLGDVVNITTDTLSELGAEDGETFLTYDKLNLAGEHIFKNNNQQNYKTLNGLKQVAGITVNTVHGNENSIAKIEQLFQPDVESMEGAAFFSSCLGQPGDYLQIRSISNYVEKRDKSKWNMPLAITNLNDFVIKFISEISN
jgi:futalosine hydrolase